MIYDSIAQFARKQEISRSTAYLYLDKWLLVELKVDQLQTKKKKPKTVYVSYAELKEFARTHKVIRRASQKIETAER